MMLDKSPLDSFLVLRYLQNKGIKNLQRRGWSGGNLSLNCTTIMNGYNPQMPLPFYDKMAA